MALECAHCGARVEAGAKRCPNCLRATGLIEATSNEAPPRRGGAPSPDGHETPRRFTARAFRRSLAVLGLVALAAAGVVVYLRTHRHGPGAFAPPAGVAPADLPAALEVGPALASWVSRVRAGGDPIGRAHAAMELSAEALRASGARLVTSAPDDVPPARSPDQIAAAMGRADGRVTTLDLARVEVAVLRAAGTSDARVAERTRAPRPDEPPDPSGVVGSYVVLVADHVVDVAATLMVAARDERPRPLDDRALAGAMLAQSALSAATHGGARDRVLALANAAVDAWRDGAVPLAVRATAWRVVGGSGGVPLAEQDLSAAIALRDDAALHLLRARLAVASGDARAAGAAAQAALSRAPGWGPAALAATVFAPTRAAVPDAGDPCGPLGAAREPWTDDAFAICQHLTSGQAPDDATRASAARLMSAAERDPMRLAWAAAGGAQGAPARVDASDRAELAAWLALLGRADLAAEALGRSDAGR